MKFFVKVITFSNWFKITLSTRYIYMSNFSYEFTFMRVRGGKNELKKGLTQICYRFFNNLANPTRLAVLEHLMNQPMSVNELAHNLGQEQSMISHNLKPLLDCRLIYSKRVGKNRVYSVNQETIQPIFNIIENHAEKFCPTGGKCLMERNKW
jgi:DNA-binding transcriptional ArsR family regulator